MKSMPVGRLLTIFFPAVAMVVLLFVPMPRWLGQLFLIPLTVCVVYAAVQVWRGFRAGRRSDSGGR